MAVAFETLTEIASFVTTTELVVLKSICLLRPRPRSTGCAQVVVSVVALAAAVPMEVDPRAWPVGDTRVETPRLELEMHRAFYRQLLGVVGRQAPPARAKHLGTVGGVAPMHVMSGGKTLCNEWLFKPIVWCYLNPCGYIKT